jgi:hypothetical protein
LAIYKNYSKYMSEKIDFKWDNALANESSVVLIGDHVFTVVTGTPIG